MYNRIFSIIITVISFIAFCVPAFAGVVDWNDDGTVTLTLDDGTEIVIDRATLGTAYGPDEKPFEGETITILSLDSGPKGGISGPLYSARPIFEELSGATVELAVPFASRIQSVPL